MSKGRVLVELPSRACWWIKWLSLRDGISTKSWVTGAVLRELARTSGVDLTQSPNFLQGGTDGEEEYRSRGQG